MYNNPVSDIATIFTWIFYLVIIIVFFVMTSNIGSIAKRTAETNARLANVEKWLRLIARIQSSVQLTDEEKALLSIEPEKKTQK